MQWLTAYPTQDHVHYLTSPDTARFEQAYLTVREQEGRVYPDEVVAQLPILPRSHPKYQEWQFRVWSTANFFRHTSLGTNDQMLDLGCGNGWFTHQLASRSGTQVLGVDVNQVELQQAARLFGAPNCHFAYGDVFEIDWPAAAFDYITLNACVQYFPDLSKLVDTLRTLLRPNGEIHFLDSPFYALADVAAARERTQAYYQERGVGTMGAHYHHHSWEALQGLAPEVRYQPDHWLARLGRKLLGEGSPFPWVVLRA